MRKPEAAVARENSPRQHEGEAGHTAHSAVGNIVCVCIVYLLSCRIVCCKQHLSHLHTVHKTLAFALHFTLQVLVLGDHTLQSGHVPKTHTHEHTYAHTAHNETRRQIQRVCSSLYIYKHLIKNLKERWRSRLHTYLSCRKWIKSPRW